ncbi:PTS sugar transporter subunit IIC [Desulfovibrio mangrovi]|uniref:PTS sugar transporter subunit IIC n=1 Tax=Desulfovibrio mangrovi TaxID=2976983 RepID=UPI002245A569|nr:PTS sugar transporter subunit IIC [Desulfovibrio mangrovi]UZP69125.1 PTS sugar transporter subunit IIC [Desulfovibrio mangrovi]
MGSSPRFFFAFSSVLRFALNFGFLERPLAAGFLWGVATGEWALAIHVAIFFELIWLDLFPAGTYIPPNAVASMLLTLGVSRYFNIQDASLLAFPMLVSLPAALLASRIEYWQRKMQNAGYNRLIQWGRKDVEDSEPGRILFRSLLQSFVMHVAFFCLCQLVLIGTIRGLSWYLGHLPVINGVEWLHLWFVAGLGGVMSLRVRRSYFVFALGLVSIVLIGIA